MAEPIIRHDHIGLVARLVVVDNDKIDGMLLSVDDLFSELASPSPYQHELLDIVALRLGYIDALTELFFIGDDHLSY